MYGRDRWRMRFGERPLDGSRPRAGVRRGAGRGAHPSAATGPASASAHYEDVDLAIVCEATYPYLTGGLSAVVHQICEGNPGLTIGIIHITWDRDSDLEPVYDPPVNVKWVMPVFQSMAEHADTFQRYTVRDLRMTRRQQRAFVDRIFAAIRSHQAGDDEPLWSLYDDSVNPRTRTRPIWPAFSTVDFMNKAVATFVSGELSFTDLFWQLRDFVSLAFAALSPDFPRASIYHAHTTGAAGLLAAAAARQNGTSFVLTEHNLYTRDTVNHVLDRSMDNTITSSTWWQLDSYESGGLEPVEKAVTDRQRAWMAWFIRIGIMSYRAADRITYLYPEAIEEAFELGGVPAKSRVVPNGLDPRPFLAGRAAFAARRAQWGGVLGAGGGASVLPSHGSDAPTRVWRLAYAARVVAIKGLLDLLESLAALRERGIDDFVLDVMGPDGEQPEYSALCRRRATELGLDAHVRFLGRVRLAEVLDRCDVLVLPSHNEGVPIVILEAMAIGLPVLATNVGGIHEVVVEELVPDGGVTALGPCGELVRPRDTEAMTDAIARLMRDPELYDRYSRAAVRRLDELFHIDVTIEHYAQLFSELGVTGGGVTGGGVHAVGGASVGAGGSGSELGGTGPMGAAFPAVTDPAAVVVPGAAAEREGASVTSPTVLATLAPGSVARHRG